MPIRRVRGGGKTRLATETTVQQIDRFRHGFGRTRDVVVWPRTVNLPIWLYAFGTSERLGNELTSLNIDRMYARHIRAPKTSEDL